jgi:hypothetical protein
MSRKAIDLSGQIFGRLEVIERDFEHPRGKGLSAYWKCKCTCGGRKSIAAPSLIYGGTQSCGCLRRETSRENQKQQSKDRVENPHPERSLLRIYKYAATQRENVWGLTDEKFYELVRQNCHYCDSSPVFVPWAQYPNFKFTANGIDRVDNKLGYIEGNVVPCCKICNRAKLTMSYPDFINYLERLCKKSGGIYLAKPVSQLSDALVRNPHVSTRE